MEYKNGSTGIEIKSAARGEVEAVFATLGVVDKDGDVTVRGAFENGAKVAISAYNHKSWEGAMPVGKGTIHEVGNEVILKGHFFVQTAAGRDAFETVKALTDDGPGTEWSYGFDVLDSGPASRNSPHGSNHRRTLRRLHVHEVSPVMRGAGIGTRVLAIKSADATRADLLRIRDNLYRDILAESKARLDDECRREALRTEVERLYGNYVKVVGVGYSYDRESIVPQTVRDAARAAIGVYAPELGLDRDQIRIKWFSAEGDIGAAVKDEFVDFWSEKPLLGRCRPKMSPNVIDLNSSLTEDDCWNVVPHELRHLSNPEESEDDVRLYESRARLQRMGLI